MNLLAGVNSERLYIYSQMNRKQNWNRKAGKTMFSEIQMAILGCFLTQSLTILPNKNAGLISLASSTQATIIKKNACKLEVSFL